ncbi:penicillin acylase family protein [Ochrovirga pacifica]|uniref:penicillin acylase family protein n=1 Tax=Ochrovirga pacifica TaxID=1042376 RepID=UPI000255A7FB|nr:penicillin acylase family protein [Ochrovirga pacifica]
MKLIKNIVLGILLLLVLIMVGGFFYLQSTKPSYQGTVKIKKIKNTEVVFDDMGVPHIYADSELDATKALGYIHAQERLWQMELLRRIASGRLAEILGKDLLEVDVFFSHLGVDKTVEKQVAALEKNPKVKALAQAYLDGVNTYINNGSTPIEFTLLGIEKENYQIKDMYYVAAYMSFSFAHAFKTDPLLSFVQKKYGSVYLKDLAINADEQTFYQKNYEDKIAGISTVNSILKKLPFPQFIGSNGWVLGPKKTTTGKVIFENDPHIGYAQPCVWYQAHIKTPDYENYGFYLGLFPFPLLAHNRDYAYGITMFENDDLDFYQILNHPTDKSKYISSTGTHTYIYRSKIIKVKGEDDVKVNLKETVLGTVFTHQKKTLDSLKTITLQWVYNEQPSRVIQAAYGLSRAKNITNFESYLEGITAPGLNYVYGDAENNIALWSVAKLHEFNADVNTKFVLNGMDSLQTQKIPLSFTENPKAINPPNGYVITSNTQPDSIHGRLFKGYYLPQDRAVAIEKGIQKKQKLSVLDVQSLANSHTNTVALANVNALVAELNLQELTSFELSVLDALVKWKGNHGLQNIEPVIYYKWTNKLLHKTFSDELPKAYFDDFVNSNLCKRTLNKIVHIRNAAWWDDVNTAIKETYKDIAMQTFKESVAALKKQLGNDISQWHWGKVHTVEHEHALAKVNVLKKLFNVGSFSIVGGNETINNTMFDFTLDGVYKVNAGPSTRRVIDFSNIENSYAIIPTGQSGNFLSPYYKNQATDYVKGVYHKMLLNEKEIRKSKNILRFEE